VRVVWPGAAGLAAVLALGLPARAAPDAPGDPDLADLQAVCGQCHNLQLVTAQARGEDEWREIIGKMVAHGAKGTDAQFDGLARYIIANLTVVNVNTAPADQIARVLDVSRAVGGMIVARRQEREIRDLADLKSIPGVDAAVVEARKDRIFF
jgi:hypothetical protein